MMPQQQPSPDTEALQELGRASVEVVHDVKNQLNGLKLYATFLRKRFERGERPADELETVNKIIAGLERAAADMNVLVRYGRPVELRPAPRTDLARLLAEVAGAVAPVGGGGESFEGDFDPPALTEALREIDAAARANASPGGLGPASLSREEAAGAPAALVTWPGVTPPRDGGAGLFGALDGNAGLRLALAAKIVRAHGGAVEHNADAVTVRLPLTK